MATTTKKKTAKSTKLNFASIKDKSVEELQTELVKTQTDLVEAQRSHAARELVSTARLTELRRHVAHIKTAINVKTNEEKA